MVEEVEMKDAGEKAKGAAPAPAKKGGKSPAPEVPLSLLAELRAIVPIVERAVSEKENRVMGRAVRLLMSLRKRLDKESLASWVQEVLPENSEVRQHLLAYLAAAPAKMESGAAEGEGPAAVVSTKRSPTEAPLPEVETFAQLAVLIFLIDQKLLSEAKQCSSATVKKLQKLNRRTMDLLAARVFFYYSLAHERTNSLADIRSTLLALNRTATLRHDEIGQETVLNLLLRNYLAYNLYDQAEKLRSKVQREESHSNQQYCRYLFYLGRIRAIQLEYTDAKDCLLQAGRKAPSAARGFRIACTKWAALVRLLLGEIPERTIFVLPGMRAALQPYYQLTNAVRIGDLELFRSVAEQHADLFLADRTHNLIVRLRQNVIRTGLRRINTAYSRISLADVAGKLQLEGGADAVDDAESIVAKAIADGGIDAVVKHSAGGPATLLSRESGDIYSTVEPQAAFHSRIAFCLNTHNEAVKAMRFPPDAHRKELLSGEERRERQLQEQELVNNIAEEDGDGF
eukprot:TRINITY_DN4396_c0_g1_i1.p1 TRINITY_DN4396_c0_g1~~TRINITY_DN4396_c0_g1_i1.p1  ORF type:complete len:513 (-),score=114.92 TRINITY_DN4396_c0_g1_i1:191-1729(-)